MDSVFVPAVLVITSSVIAVYVKTVFVIFCPSVLVDSVFVPAVFVIAVYVKTSSVIAVLVKTVFVIL